MKLQITDRITISNTNGDNIIIDRYGISGDGWLKMMVSMLLPIDDMKYHIDPVKAIADTVCNYYQWLSITDIKYSEEEYPDGTVF